MKQQKWIISGLLAISLLETGIVMAQTNPVEGCNKELHHSRLDQEYKGSGSHLTQNAELRNSKFHHIYQVMTPEQKSRFMALLEKPQRDRN